MKSRLRIRALWTEVIVDVDPQRVGILALSKAFFAEGQESDALFADQRHSIPDNALALFG